MVCVVIRKINYGIVLIFNVVFVESVKLNNLTLFTQQAIAVISQSRSEIQYSLAMSNSLIDKLNLNLVTCFIANLSKSNSDYRRFGFIY